MGFSVGIVGLPNVGKSTLFKALTKQPIDISNYPFCTIDPNVGVVSVPDERLDSLAKIFQPKKVVPTAIEFFDIAGLVKGAHKGEGLGNQFLANISQVDAIAQIVRCFSNKDIVHVDGAPDPLRDIKTINLELILKDLSAVENLLNRVKKEARANNPTALKKLNFFERVKKHLEKEILLNSFDINTENDDETAFLKELQPLTRKPIIYILNFSDEETPENIDNTLKNIQSARSNDKFITLNTKIEEEYNSLTKEEIVELELPQSQIAKFIKACYETLDIITYYTAGEPEARAWTIPKNSTAPQAGAAIHTDFEKKFIKADIIGFDDFIKAGNIAKARELGYLRTEGKEYIVQDGDIITFKI